MRRCWSLDAVDMQGRCGGRWRAFREVDHPEVSNGRLVKGNRERFKRTALPGVWSDARALVARLRWCCALRSTELGCL